MIREELVKIREKEKITQKEMAEKIGISFNMYQALEYGLRNPSLKTMNKLKQAFPRSNIDKIFLN